MSKINSIEGLLKLENFEFWKNGVVWVLNSDVVVAIAYGTVSGFSCKSGRSKVLTIRRGKSGICSILDTELITEKICRAIQPFDCDFGDGNLRCSSSVIDPMINSGQLIMQLPKEATEQDLRWHDQPYYGIIGRNVAYRLA